MQRLITVNLGLGQVLGHAEAGAGELEHLLPQLPGLAVEYFDRFEGPARHGASDDGDLITDVGHPMTRSKRKHPLLLLRG